MLYAFLIKSAFPGGDAMSVRRAVIMLLSLLALGFQTSEKAPQIDSIRKEQLKADLFYLASDGMQGRMTGTSTNSLASEYIRSRFEHIGLKPAVPDGSFFVQRQVLPDRNVVGLIEGADPNLKNEWLILCAHYDHNGMDGDRTLPGADDDASGVVALFEIAEAYALAAHAGQRPRRSILFASWDSEELGLLGAWAYVETPLWPLERTVAVLNLDMIGRNEEVPEGSGSRFRGLELQTAESNSNAINVLGTSRSPDIKMEVEKANRGIGLELKFRYDNNLSNLMRRSDHWPFLNAGVPALWFLAGLHPDYHTIYDRPEKVNYLKMEKIVRMVHQMSWNLAQQDSRPAFKGPKL
jgi:hypothetical protein